MAKLVLEDEVPKYKKKTKSNTSKAFNKTKHKHEYKDCLFIRTDSSKNKHAGTGTYCTICGKIGEFNNFETEKTEYGHVTLDYEEVLAKYPKLERREVDSILQQYVPIINEV